MPVETKTKYTLFILSLWLAFYYAIQFAFVNSHYDFSTPLDNLITFNPHFIWIYHTLVPVILITTISLVKARSVFFTTFFACLLATFLLNAFYILMPCEFPRESLTPSDEDISTWLVIYTRMIDGASNTFPSGHVTFSWIMFLAAKSCELVKRYPLIKNVYFVWAVGISLSTVFLKQHFAADVISGIAAAYICFSISQGIIQNRLLFLKN